MLEEQERAIEMIDLLIEEVGRLQIIPLETTYVWDNQDLQEELRNLKTVLRSAEWGEGEK